MHTIQWKDGLKVIRVMRHKGQIVLWLEWQGKWSEVRLGKRVAEIRRLQGKVTP